MAYQGRETEQPTLSVVNETTIRAIAPKDSNAFKQNGTAPQQFTFTKVLGPETSQKEMFDECIATHVKKFILGGNCLTFAYGTTNAGKTFTMLGNRTSPGLIPRALDALFNNIEGKVDVSGGLRPIKLHEVIQLDAKSITEELKYKKKLFLEVNQGKRNAPEPWSIGTGTCESESKTSYDSPLDVSNETDMAYGVWISFAEVYNESIYDLLVPMKNGEKRTPLKLGQDKHAYIKDLKSIHVKSCEEGLKLLEFGSEQCSKGQTAMNKNSSRSHKFFFIKLVNHERVSVFQFCDLAGVENPKKSHTKGNALRETGMINTTLATLRRCVDVSRFNQRSKMRATNRVPFKDSKLTSIFEEAFMGGGTVNFLLAVDPSTISYDESLAALHFGAEAQHILLPSDPHDAPCSSAASAATSRFHDPESSSSSSSSSCSNKSEEQECGDCLIKDTEIEALREKLTKYKNKYRAAKTKIHALEIMVKRHATVGYL